MPTKEEIESRMTARGGWMKEDLAKWGVSWPPPKGWKEAIIAGHDRYYASGKLTVKQAFKLSMDRYLKSKRSSGKGDAA